MRRSGSTPSVVRDYPFRNGGADDLAELYAYLREHEPVCRVRLSFGGEAWLVTRYDDVRRVLSDSSISRAAALRREMSRPNAGLVRPDMLPFTDGARHARLRRLAVPALTPRRIADIRPRLDGLASELVENLVRCGPPSDLLALVARPFSIKTIQELFGIPSRDRKNIETILGKLETTPEHQSDEIRAAAERLHRYLEVLVALRREDPAEDLVSALVEAARGDDQVSEVELVQLASTLIMGPYVGVVGQFTNFSHVLLGDRARYELLAANPTLIPGALEETLRRMPLDNPVDNPGIALRDIEISGTVIRAGEVVITALASANRDGNLTAEGDRLDVTREPTPHLAFGHGLHFCPGAHLARMMLQAVLTALVTRLPGLRLAAPADGGRPDQLMVAW